MIDHACCLEAQESVRLNWKEQFRLRSSLVKTADGVTLVGTEECRRCGALWYYDGRVAAPAPAPAPVTAGAEPVADQHVYWYSPATAATIERCDSVAGDMDGRHDEADPAVTRAVDALDTAMRAARGDRPWLRLVDQSAGAEWVALGSWQPRPALAD